MSVKSTNKSKSFLGSFFNTKKSSASSKASEELPKSIEEIREKTEDISEKVSDFSEENKKLSSQILRDAKTRKILIFITIVSIIASIILILQSI